MIVNFRREPFEIPPTALEDRPKIPRNPNVFASWQIDTHEVIENCIRHDIEGWKVDGFVKDPNERREIVQALKKNFVYLA